MVGCNHERHVPPLTLLLFELLWDFILVLSSFALLNLLSLEE